LANEDYSTFVFRNKVYKPYVVDSLKKHNKELYRYILHYIDRNNATLFSNTLHQLYWHSTSFPNDLDILWKTTNTDDDLIGKAIKESNQLKPNWKIYAKTEYWVMIACIKFFEDNKMQKERDMVIMYLSFAMYASIFYKFFRFPPIEAVMEYTVNNLSNRYDLKKLGSLYKVLEKISLKNHDTYKDFFLDKNFCDRRIIEYIMYLHTRIRNFVYEIKVQYEKNKAEGKYLNSEKDNNDTENYHENDNLSYTIERLSNKITTKIITSGINNKIAESAAKISNVSIVSIKEAVNKTIEKETEEIREFILLFLQQYLIVDNHPIETISSKNFLTYANKIYSKSNTNDKGVIRIKELLDKWLTENCDKYTKTERVASKIAYRKGIFLYFALSIQAVINNNY
jgi:hypothetical protein